MAQGRAGARGIRVGAGVGGGVDGDEAYQEGAEGRQADADDADVDFDYGPVA